MIYRDYTKQERLERIAQVGFLATAEEGDESFASQDVNDFISLLYGRVQDCLSENDK